MKLPINALFIAIILLGGLFPNLCKAQPIEQVAIIGALSTTFQGKGANCNWSNAANWTNGVPTASMDAVISIDFTSFCIGCVVDINTAVCKGLTIDSIGTLIFTDSSSLTAGRTTINGFLSMAGGTLTLNGGMAISGGSANFSGGTVNWNAATNQTIGSNFSFYNLSVTGSGTATLGTNITVKHDFTQSAGTFSLSNKTMTCQEDFSRSAGTFTASTGTVSFTGSLVSMINGASVTTLNNVTVAKAITAVVLDTSASILNGNLTITSGSFILGTSLTVSGNLTISAGTLNLLGNNMTVKGNWTKNGGTFTPGTATVNFEGSPATVLGGTQSTAFYNLNINKADGITFVTLGANITVTNDVLLSTGILAASTFTMTVEGNWTNNGAAFSGDTGTVIFGGTDSQATIGGTTTTVFNNLTMNIVEVVIGNDTLTFGINTTVNGNLLLSDGELVLGGTTLTVQKNWTRNGGTIVIGTSIVQFTGSADSTIAGTLISTFYKLTISKSNATVFLTNDSTVANTLSLPSGTLDFSGSGTVPGNTRILSTTGTKVIYSGSNSQELAFGAGGVGVYFDLEINKSGGTATVNAAAPATVLGDTWGIVVLGDITFTKGAVTQSAGTQGIFGLGNVTIANDASVVITGNEADLAFYKDLTIGANATYNPGSGTLTGIVYVFGNGVSNLSGKLDLNSIWVAKTNGGTVHMNSALTLDHWLSAWNFNAAVTANIVELESFSHTIGGILPRGIKPAGSVNLGLIKFESSTVTFTRSTAIDFDFWSDVPTAQVDFGTSTVIYAATASATLPPAGYDMYNLEIQAGTGNTVSLLAALNVNQNLTLTSGTMDVTASDFDLNVGGNVTATSGLFNLRAGRFTFVQGALATNVTVTGTLDFNNVIVNQTKAVNWSSQAKMANLTVTAGTFNHQAGTITMAGNLTVDVGGSYQMSGDLSDLVMSNSKNITVNGTFKVSPATGKASISTGGITSKSNYALIFNSTATVDVTNLDIRHVNGVGIQFINVSNLQAFTNVAMSYFNTALIGPVPSQFMKFTTTGMNHVFENVSFDNSPNNASNVAVIDSDNGGDTYLLFEDSARSGTDAGESKDSDADDGTGGDLVADDGVTENGGAIINWVSAQVLNITSIFKTPGASPVLVQHPIAIFNFSTLTFEGYVMGLAKADSVGQSVVTLVDASGNMLDWFTIPSADGDLLGIATTIVSEGKFMDIDGDGIEGEVGPFILIYAVTTTNVIHRRMLIANAFALPEAGTPWINAYNGAFDDITKFTSPPIADATNIYIGATNGSDNWLVWLAHAEVGGTRTLQQSSTPANLPVLQSSLMVLNVQGVAKAFVGSDVAIADGFSHLYRLDAGVVRGIEFDATAASAITGIPSFRNNKYSIGTAGGEMITLNSSDWSHAPGSPYSTDAASSILGGVFSDHLSNRYFGDSAGNLYRLNPDGTLSYSVSSLGAAITATPIAAGGTVFVPVGNKLVYIADNPANPKVTSTVTTDGVLSSITVNVFNPTGVKLTGITDKGTYVQFGPSD